MNRGLTMEGLQFKTADNRKEQAKSEFNYFPAHLGGKEGSIYDGSQIDDEIFSP